MNPIDWWLNELSGPVSTPTSLLDKLFWVLKTLVALPIILLSMWLLAQRAMRFLRWSNDAAIWRTQRQPCAHCGENTLHISKGMNAVCAIGTPCCPGCMLDHTVQTEPKLICPIDNRLMEKTVDSAKGLVGACCTNGHALLGTDLYVADALVRDKRMRR